MALRSRHIAVSSALRGVRPPYQWTAVENDDSTSVLAGPHREAANCNLVVVARNAQHEQFAHPRACAELDVERLSGKIASAEFVAS